MSDYASLSALFSRASFGDTRAINTLLERPQDFGYRGDDEGMFTTWGLGPVIETRDSEILECSNASAITRRLAAEIGAEGEAWHVTCCNHWAVGWVNHLSIRVLLADGTPNVKILSLLASIYGALSDYPILDEADFSNRESDAEYENFKCALHSFLHKHDWNCTEDQGVEAFCDHWREYGNETMVTRWPGEEEITEALTEAGYHNVE